MNFKQQTHPIKIYVRGKFDLHIYVFASCLFMTRNRIVESVTEVFWGIYFIKNKNTSTDVAYMYIHENR